MFIDKLTDLVGQKNRERYRQAERDRWGAGEREREIEREE